MSVITQVELLAAFYLRVRTGTLTRIEARQAELVFRHERKTHYQLLPVAPWIVDEAMRLVAVYPLRGYDAVQLATALIWNAEEVALVRPSVIFLSADRNLLQAATAEGLTIDDPTLHP